MGDRASERAREKKERQTDRQRGDGEFEGGRERKEAHGFLQPKDVQR